MLLTTMIIITALVIINLLLLKFSCNKIKKQDSVDKKTILLESENSTTNSGGYLAPTGS